MQCSSPKDIPKDNPYNCMCDERMYTKAEKVMWNVELGNSVRICLKILCRVLYFSFLLKTVPFVRSVCKFVPFVNKAQCDNLRKLLLSLSKREKHGYLSYMAISGLKPVGKVYQYSAGPILKYSSLFNHIS